MHILLIDDHILFREAILHVLNQLDDQIFVLEAGNAEEAAQLVSHARNLDIILLDIDLPEIDGLTVLPKLRELSPSTPIVVLSGSETTAHVKQAMDDGAVGYIPKSCSSHEMIGALRIVLQGDVFIPPRLLGKLGSTKIFTTMAPNSHPADALLTSRQIEVLSLMARGLPNKSIAKSLNLAVGTVKLHVASIMRGLGCHNRTEAVSAASRLGLVPINNLPA